MTNALSLCLFNFGGGNIYYYFNNGEFNGTWLDERYYRNAAQLERLLNG